MGNMITDRVIPVMLLDDEGFYKTTKFKNPSYIGDPINTIKLFNDKEVDEVIVLGFRNTQENKKIDFDILEELASEAFMPMAYGGGIRTVDDANKIFSIGFEKVIFNSAFFDDENLIKECVNKFGAQSIVISLDYKKKILGSYYCYKNSGTIKSRLTVPEAIAKCNVLGIGEIMLHNIDRDGTQNGYQLNEFTKWLSLLNLPIIICGGAGSYQDLEAAFEVGVSAAAAGAMFVYHGPHRAVLINYPSPELMEQIHER